MPGDRKHNAGDAGGRSWSRPTLRRLGDVARLTQQFQQTYRCPPLGAPRGGPIGVLRAKGCGIIS